MPLFKRAQRISFSREMWGHPLFPWTIIFSVLLILAMGGLIFWKVMPIGVAQTVILLHYNVYFGVDLLGPWWQIFFLPILGLILLTANMFFARLLWNKEHLLSFFFAVVSILVEVILLIAVLLTTLLNL